MAVADIRQKYLHKNNVLILHLTDRCNNRCSFCMIHDIHSAFCFPYDLALELINKMPVESKIDFFGGEPTLYPHFFDLLKYAISQDMECSIATNGRLFAKKTFTQAVADISQRGLYVRTSLHGSTDGSHDSLTRVKGSFRQLMIGLHNIVSEQMPCQVNIVLTKNNLAELMDMTKLIISKGIKRIKFGLIIGSQSCINMVPTLSEIRSQLLKSLYLARANSLRILIEKAPMCLAPEYINEFSTERDLCSWPRYFDDKGECGRCIVRKWCDGLDPGYVHSFGTEGITHIENIPSDLLKPFPSFLSKDHVDFLKFNLFSMPDETMDLQKCKETMINLIDDAKKRFARIAFIPFYLQD